MKCHLNGKDQSLQERVARSYARLKPALRRMVLWLQFATSLFSGVIYLPFVMGPPSTPVRENFYGLAIVSPPTSDLNRLGATWFYDWGPVNYYPTATQEFVPMLREMLPSDALSSSFAGPILVGNEPGNPNQTNLTPVEAVKRLNEIRRQYPHARLICCGTLSYNANWVQQFIAAGGKPDAWHFHAYVEGPFSAADLTQQLTVLHQFTGGNAWISEYGVLNGDASQLTELTLWFEQQDWIERIAPYTNRQPHTNEFWELDPAVELVFDDGRLTPLGQAYTERSKRYSFP